MNLWSLKGKKVLIIDDFQDMLFMLRSMIAPLNPDFVALAKKGEDAIEHMEETKFDIVFCDYNLGKGKDGQQILEEAKHRKLLPYSSIYIMVTAENTSDMVMGAIEYLPDDYISKPFTQTVIHSRLRKLMDKKENLTDISHALSNNNSSLAIKHCDKLLADKSPNRLDILKIKGEQFINLKEYDKAAELYESILEERDIPWAFLALGKTRYFQKDYNEAIVVLDKLINENSANVAAYDWLAKAYEALGNLDKAKEMLSIGIEKSPKSILRQRSLAKVAYKNNDLETAETAYKKAINVGKNSCFKSTDDYTSLTKTLIDSDKTKDAMNVANSILKDFSKDANSEMAAAITEGMVCNHTGDTEAANEKLEKALSLMKENPQALSSDSALELTGLCLATGNEEQANEITKNLIKNNHEDKELIEKTKQLYSDADMSDFGSKLIEGVTKEIIDTNNEGARLLKAGKIEESIELFVKAAEAMPENVIVNLNTAYSILMLMSKTGQVKNHSASTTKYLERVHKVDPANKKYHELTELHQQIVMKAKNKAA